MNRYHLLAITISLGFTSVAVAQGKKTFIEYKVVRGDTCTGIAKKVYGSGQLCYKMISKYNKMNRKFVIIPGQVLKLPTREELKVSPAKPDAVLTQRKGTVDVRAPKAKWSNAPQGKELYRLWRVNSGQKSSAEVSFTKTKSKLQMRENTLVIIYGPTKDKSKRVASKAVLERGTLKSRLAELSGQSNDMVVETPASSTVLGAGDALVAVEASGTTRVANFTSQKVTIQGKDDPKEKKKKRRKKKRRIVKLPKNMGSKIVPGQDPTPPKPLPTSPIWTKSGVVHILAVNGLSKQKIGWKQVPKAISYRVELFGDAKGGELLDQFKIDAKFNNIVLQDLPPQTYFARVSTIDEDAFESKPSQPLQLVIHDGKVKKAKTVASNTKPNTIYVGSQMSIPGLLCKTPQMKSTQSQITLTQQGPQEVACQTPSGQTIEPVTINVVSIETRGLPKDTLTLKQPQTVSFSTTPQVSQLAIEAPPQVKVTPKRQANGQWVLNIEQAEGAPSATHNIKIFTGEATEKVQLASMAVNTIGATVKEKPPAPKKEKDPTFNVGIFTTGQALFSDSLTLDNQTLDTGFRFGVGSEYLLSQRFVLGGQLNIGNTSFNNQNRHVNTFGLNVHGAFNFLTGRVKPYLLVGAGVDFVRYYGGFDPQTGEFNGDDRRLETQIPFQAGLGVKIGISNYDLVIQAQEYFLPFNAGGLAYYTGASLGFVGNF